ncbi:MAG: hypothetical protein HQM03_14535 [Magnetococcales bacterium]|nr:hypothetical protein [Magnetococcales bacterium]
MNGMTHALSEEMALRIGLASRELAPLTPGRLISRLCKLAGGRFPNPERMQTITPCELKPLLQEDLPGVTGKRLRAALHWLTTWEPEVQLTASVPPAMPAPAVGAVRVAMSGKGLEGRNGHFATCAEFGIWDVTQEEIRWVEDRKVAILEGEENLLARTAMIRDARILVVTRIGGPSAARVTRMGLMPIMMTDGVTGMEWLERLRQVLAGSSPPWLRRITTTHFLAPRPDFPL